MTKYMVILYAIRGVELTSYPLILFWSEFLTNYFHSCFAKKYKYFALKNPAKNSKIP